MMPSRFARPVASVALVLFAACDPKVPVVDLTFDLPISLFLGPDNLPLNTGQTGTLVAVVTGTTNQTVTGTASNNLVTVTGGANGTLTITAGATAGTSVVTAVSVADATARDASTVTITAPAPPVIARINVTPASTSLLVGDSTKLAVAVLDSAGRVLTGIGPPVWQTTNSAVASVSSIGLVRGASVGSAVIRATLESHTDSAIVTVIPAGNGRYAYALADQPAAASYSPAAGNFYSSAGQPITITRTAVGRYQVSFEGLLPGTGQTQVFLVTSTGAGVGPCKIAGVSASVPGALVVSSSSAAGVVASVACYNLHSEFADHAFAILMLGSGALPGRFAFGWADQPTSALYTPATAYNSSGQNVQVTRIDEGEYRVAFTGNARGASGPPETTFVVAAGAGDLRCTVAGFLSNETLPVHCQGPPFSNEYDAAYMTVLLERGLSARRFAFTSIAQPTDAIIATQSFSSIGAAIEVVRPAAGRTDVTFRGLARLANSSEIVQVVARSEDGAFCQVHSWMTVGSDLTARVECFTADGAPTTTEFRILVMQ